MKRHDTPHEVAIVLARHLRRNVKSLLDPAVGSGELLKPMLPRLAEWGTNLVCIDSDPTVAPELEKTFGSTFLEHSVFEAQDFIDWNPRTQKFECVVMNPPFAGKKNQQIQIKTENGSTKFAPIEIAFLLKVIDLLLPNGRLLAVLPSSVVTSENSSWARSAIREAGAIRFIHELPPGSFPNVESRMYLLVFDKGQKDGQIRLLNHDLNRPETLSLESGAVNGLSRLDYGYHRAERKLKIAKRNEKLCWTRLDNVAAVLRGSEVSPQGSRYSVHTNDFVDGRWRGHERHEQLALNEEKLVCVQDILVKRVGRDCFKSFGSQVGMVGIACSDCILIVRPRVGSDQLRLLFTLKIFFAQVWTRPLIEKGTGASYISAKTLQNLEIPYGLSNCYPQMFQKFCEEEASLEAQPRENLLSISRSIF